MTIKGKVLVTGGSGLIGSRLVRRLLKEGVGVRVLDTRFGELDADRANENLEFMGLGGDDLHGGMVDKGVVDESLRGIDTVYHLAVNWDGASWKHALPLADLFEANIRGTLNLLEASNSCGVKHFIYSSSAAVYGQTERTITLKRRTREGRVDEDTVCRPELWDGDPGPGYAILKLTLERLCLMYYRQHGLPVTIFRVEYVFAGERELRDHANIHVDDVVQALFIAALNRKAYGQIFNLAYPSPYISTRRIRRTLGWSPKTTEAFLSQH